MSWFTLSTVNRSSCLCVVEDQTCRNSSKFQLTSAVVFIGAVWHSRTCYKGRVGNGSDPSWMHPLPICQPRGQPALRPKETEKNSYSSSHGSILVSGCLCVCVKQQERDVSGMRCKCLNSGNNQLQVGSQRPTVSIIKNTLQDLWGPSFLKHYQQEIIISIFPKGILIKMRFFNIKVIHSRCVLSSI